MKEDKLYGVRMFAGVGNAQTLDLRGAGSLYIEPNKYYYFENTPISFINRLVELKKINITYEITDNRKGCYRTIDMSKYEVRTAREVLSDIKGLYETKADKKAKVEDKEVEVVETIEFVPEEPVKVETEEIENVVIPEVTDEGEILVNKEDILSDEEVAELSEDDVITLDGEATIVDEDEEVEDVKIEIPSEAQLNKMSKQDLLDLAYGLGISEVSDINTKREIRNAILSTIE